MPLPDLATRRERTRQLTYLATPALWAAYPFLPVTRPGPSGPECGVLFDAKRVCGLYGFSATVFLVNLFDLPPTVADLLTVPKEMFDIPDEIYLAGWRVD